MGYVLIESLCLPFWSRRQTCSGAVDADLSTAPIFFALRFGLFQMQDGPSGAATSDGPEGPSYG